MTRMPAMPAENVTGGGHDRPRSGWAARPRQVNMAIPARRDVAMGKDARHGPQQPEGHVTPPRPTPEVLT